uniref:Uncharacterized protein n=1 Tax=Solanum lycopersicum TaxID=4081 RepID=A0A3Q7JT23_SOLLC
MYRGWWAAHEEGRRVVKESFRGLQGRLMKDGRMDGYGAFIGAGGDMYRGWWAADRKHGFGDKLVLGSEICNKGKGAMFGEMGMSILENGEKGYEGDWETCYTSRSSKQEFSTGGGNGGQVLNRSSVRKRNVNLPRTCIWESDGEVGDIICDIVDNREASSMFSPCHSEYMLAICGSDALRKLPSPGKSGSVTDLSSKL